MKKYMVATIGFALLGGSVLLAQTPPGSPYGGGAPPGPVTGPGPTPGVIVPDGGGCCAQGGCCHTRTICCPEHYIKHREHWCYTSCGEPLCLCFFHNLFGSSCGNCGPDGHCEHPYHKRVLVKLRRDEDTDCVKCCPREVPDCGHGHHQRNHGAPVVEYCPPVQIGAPVAPTVTVPPQGGQGMPGTPMPQN
jgi:hypothetical protein